MTYTDQVLENFLKMLHKTVFTIDRCADKVLARNDDGTFSQFLVLTAVHHCPGFSQKKIAAFLQLTPAAISRQIDAFVKERLIERLKNPQSRRAHTIKLTKSGEKVYALRKQRLLKALHEKMSTLRTSDIENTSAILASMLYSFQPEMKKATSTKYEHGVSI